MSEPLDNLIRERTVSEEPLDFGARFEEGIKPLGPFDPETQRALQNIITETTTTIINNTTTNAEAAGSTGQIQFNTSDELDADPDFTWDEATKTLTVGSYEFNGPNNFLKISDDLSDEFQIYGSDNTGNSNDGSNVFIRGGTGDDGFNGGSVSLVGGPVAGSNNGGNGGGIVLQAEDGQSGGGLGGSVDIYTGSGDGTGGGGGGDAGALNIILGSADSDSYKNGYVLFQSDTGAESYRRIGTVNTTNATPTNISIRDAIPLPTSRAVMIEARVVARRTGGSSGSAQDSAGYVRHVTYKNIAGTVSIVGAVDPDYTAEDQGGWECSFDVVGTDIYLQVTGAANNNISWSYDLLYIYQ